MFNQEVFTYDLLRVARRETHSVHGLSFIVEVSAALQEAEHSVQEGVETACFLVHLHKHRVEFVDKGWGEL